jgi:hypothetical protein
LDIDFIEVIFKMDSVLKAMSSKIAFNFEGIDQQWKKRMLWNLSVAGISQVS